MITKKYWVTQLLLSLLNLIMAAFMWEILTRRHSGAVVFSLGFNCFVAGFIFHQFLESYARYKNAH
jgi:hypothetical protein